ncbi:MAG: LLM class flavin-dependent oxidoreductase [Dehalococcoidia bacterium]|nr:LLM class flavin-dependent oxidoreductase [Dehalococcoidia bacterium]
MQIGILNLVDWYPGAMSQEDRYRQVIEEAVLAEQLGFDTYWIGEHHFSHYICPHPVPLLAAIAARTSRIRIGTGVALGVHHDPIRLAEDYAMLDVVSGGRVDLVLGRGLYLQGYRGFNQDYAESRARQEECARIVRGAWSESPFTYDGQFRHVPGVDLQPRPVQQPHPPLWIGGGRGLDSVLFAANEGFHLALPSVLGPAEAFAPLADAYREGLPASGRDPAAFHVSAGQHTYIGESDAAAEAEFEAHYMAYMRLVANEVRPEVYAGTELEGVAAGVRKSTHSDVYEKMVRTNAKCGSPDAVAERICRLYDAVKMDHYWSYFSLGGISTPKLFACMERFAAQVIPAVRAHAGA